MTVFKFFMYGIHFLVSIILIALVISQTSKHEGLGVVGGSSGPSLRGRAGLEEQLSTYTKYAAALFMVLSAALFILAKKFGWT
jgi:protein translocase SecG subunit